MVAAWLIDPGSRGLGLKDLAWTRLKDGDDADHGADRHGQEPDHHGRTCRPRRPPPMPAPTRPSRCGWRQLLLPELEERGADAICSATIEMPLVPVLVAMEAAGIKLDVACLRQMSRRSDRPGCGPSKREIQQIAGYAFNVNSTQQLADVLFGKLRLPAEGLKKTKAGTYSTAADVLEGLRGRHEIVDLILEQRQLSKLLSTYVDALPSMVNPRTGPAAHVVQPDRRRNRAHQLQRAQPAEHPGAHRRRAGDPAAPLWPRRAGGCCRPTTRRSSCASWPTSPGTSTCWRPSPAARTSTPAPPPRSTASRSAR